MYYIYLFILDARKAHSTDDCPHFACFFSSPSKVLWGLWQLPRVHDKLFLFPARCWIPLLPVCFHWCVLGTFLPFTSLSFSSALQPRKEKFCQPLPCMETDIGYSPFGNSPVSVVSQRALSFFLSGLLLGFHLCSLVWFDAGNSRGLIPAR